MTDRKDNVVKLPRSNQRGSTLDHFADLPRWVAWREQKRNGRLTKMPHDPKRHRLASSNEPQTWGTRKQAQQAWRQLDDARPGGVGIVLGELDDGELLMGIDLDACVDAKLIKPWAIEVLNRFDTYAEVSPSGKGIKLFFLVAPADASEVEQLFGRNDEGKGKTRKAFVADKHCELVLDRGRYYAVTNDWLQDWPDTLRTVSVADVRWLIEIARPRFLEAHGVSRDVAPSKRDESGSGYGWRFMRERKAAGDSFEQACAAISDDQGAAGDWARRVDERQLRRAWDTGNNSDGETRPLISRRIDQFERRELEWLWHPFIPLGMITTIQGDKGTGKSTAILDIAARISKERLYPCFGNDETKQAPLGSVIILCKENDISRIIRPRLEAAGAALSRIHTLGYEVSDDPDQIDPLERLDTSLKQIEKLIAEIGDVKMIIIDPITDYVGKTDMYRDNQVRTLLNPLGRLASRYNFAVLNILHINKNEDMSARYRGLGSVAFRNVSQSTLMVTLNGDTGERYLAQDAANLLPKTRAVTFSMTSVGAYPRITWGREWHDDVDLDEIMTHKRASKLEHAKSLLRDWLDGGPKRTKDLKRWAEKEGISWRTMEEAKSSLQIDANKNGGEWWWKLP